MVGQMTREERIEALTLELTRQRERIEKVEGELGALKRDQRLQRKVLRDFLKHLKGGERRIGQSIERLRSSQ